MIELLNLIPILKIGASKDTYPVYAQFINSRNNVLETCNNKIYIKIFHNMKNLFQGAVNIFILENILNILKNNYSDYSFEHNSDTLTIRADDRYKTDLLISDIDFPVIENISEDCSYLELDECIINAIKIAYKFTGIDILSNVYLDNKGIIASDKYRAFSFSIDLPDVKNPIAIDNKVLSLLSPGCFITTYKNNTVIKFNNGLATFTVDILDYFPSDKIRSAFENITENSKLICNSLKLKDAIEKVTPVLFGENEVFATLCNNNKNMTVSTTSGINGESKIQISTDLEDDYEIIIDTKLFKNIPSSFDVYTVKEMSELVSKLYLETTDYNSQSEIILMGAMQ